MHIKHRVALLVETSTTYGRKILEGIAQYQRSHHPWSVYLDERELRAPPPPWLLHREWDGIICRTTTPELAKAFVARKIPVVDLNDLYSDLGLPRIRSNMHAIGVMGAHHLLERGFRNFAFCGFTRETWSDERRDGFVNELARHGFDCSIYESPWRGRGVPSWDLDQTRISKWIQGLPSPLGIMACNDIRGQQILNACAFSEIQVPERVAVIGVDNEEVLCDLCNPQLSSIQPNSQRIGYEAAELLGQMMNQSSTRPSLEERLIDPVSIVTRHSTDTLAIDDADMVSALLYIREHACDGVTVDQVVAHLSVSRSFLERRFRKYLGRTPQAEIRQIQIKRIKQLLEKTNLSLESIARLSGFTHPEYLSVAFKKAMGQTPGSFRKLFNQNKRDQ